MSKAKLLLLMISLLAVSAFGREYHVSKAGNDSNKGTHGSPFLTINRAAEVLRPGDTCLISDGIYSETVRPAHSGSESSPILFRKLNTEGRVIISGLDPIEHSEWKKVSPTRYRASCKLILGHENQVFLGDKMIFEARWPNTGPILLEPTLAVMEEGTTPELIVDSKLPDYDYTGANVWVHAPMHWSNWTTKITGNPSSGQISIEDTAPFHVPKRHVTTEGAEYYVFGIKDALDADNEWFFDAKEQALYVHTTNGKLPTESYFVKQRMVALDLRDRSHIQFEGIDIVGATIETNETSSHLVFDWMTLTYPYFSSIASQGTGLGQNDKGVRFMGKHCKLRNSEVAYSSGTGVALYGEFNQILNCFIHDNDFIGTYASCVQLGGKGNVISHCTLTRSGRSVIDYAAMYQALVQHCDMSYSGMLTSDLGLTYGNVIEGGNSEIRYNLLHDNQGDHLNMGLYYDHGTQNIISHHNIVFGVNYSAFHLNQYAAYHLVYNNTFISDQHGFRNIWGNKYEPELTGVRIVNNVFGGDAETASPNYHWSNNLVDYTGFDASSPFAADAQMLGRGQYIEGISAVGPNDKPGIGAIESDQMPFPVGHDFENPPVIDTNRSKPLYRNMIGNSAFEHEDHLSPWQSRGDIRKVNHKIKIQIDEDTAVGRMGRHSVELVGKGSEIHQVVAGLLPNASYRFIAFLRVENDEAASIGVRYADGSEFLSPRVTSGAPAWRQVNLSFVAPADGTDVTIFVRRTSGGSGTVHVDDTGLILESVQ